MPDFIKINDKDDVIIALKDFHKGETVDGISLLDDIKQGHKIAIHDMKAGHKVIKYGSVIGILTSDVAKGQWIHSHNLTTSLNEKPVYFYKKAVLDDLLPSNRTFMGFLRKDGRAGIRDDIYIIPTVGCINGSIALMKEAFLAKHPEAKSQVKLLTHPYGCSQLGDDLHNTQKILAGLAKNPNAGGVLIVGLGCENNRLSSFMKMFPTYDPERLIFFSAQEQEDDVGYGEEQLEKLYKVILTDKRVPLPLSKLAIGLKCGGSDGFSGLTANPLVGLISDTIGISGGKVALTEVPEMFGAEQQLMNRSQDDLTYHKVVALIENFKNYYAKNNQPCYENPSPGNKDGGITTLEEKSLGCVLKGGHLEVEDVLDIGDPLVHSGLTLVNGPGNDLVASTNLAAAGATLILFTTGRGTPFGCVVPTMKIATNHRLAAKKPDWIDYDGENSFDKGFKAAHDELLDLLIDVCSGKPVKAESNDTALIAIFKTGVTL